jgi:predicted TIM-barrel fold metal-dependent hydrolase
MSDGPDRYAVISADMHAGADIVTYKSYLPGKWHEEFDAWALSYVDPWHEMGAVTGDDLRMGNASGGDQRNWDSARRPRTAAELERRWAGLRAHNRWLVEFCGELPGRRAGIAQIFLNDVAAAVEEIRWAHEHGLHGGVLLPGVAPNTDLAPLYADCYEPLWAACAELDMPLNFHGSMAYGEVGGRVPFELQRAIDSIEAGFFCQRVIWHLVISGVFERHPTLKLVLTETNGVGWVAPRLAELDGWFGSATNAQRGRENVYGPTVSKLSLLPGEYYQRNCYNGASFMVPKEVPFRHAIGVDRIMWGADYPHSEGTFPFTREALRASFSDVPESECRAMLGLTAAAVYGFDRRLIASVAARIGPAVAEVAQPLDVWPKQPEDSVCPVFAQVPVHV